MFSTPPMNIKWRNEALVKEDTSTLKKQNLCDETRKLEENIGGMLFDIGLSNIFLDMCLQARETKAKINKWDYIKPKSFCIAKETFNKMKKQHAEQEKVFANDIQ